MNPETIKILVIDDEIGSVRSSRHKSFKQNYGEMGCEWAFCDSRDEDGNFSVDIAIEFVRLNLDTSIILLDIMFGSQDRLGLKILEKIKDIFPYIPVLMLTSVSDSEIRDRCLRKAETYLIKDTFSKEELNKEIQHYAIPSKDRIVGSSEKIREIRKKILGYAASQKQAVLITGATGTGKELTARNIHRLSERRSGTFIALNCAQINESLKGSELFGHVRGAFTGADKDRIGNIEAADGGTLFLDEIGSMHKDLQASILRVIEDGFVTRVGENRVRNVNVRIIAATNSDLSQMVAEGSFREDLFYRLCGLTVNLPELKERASDIPELVDYWLSFWHYRDYPSDLPFRISRKAIDFLMVYSWPGNVRQMVQALGSAIVECYKIRNEPEIDVKHLPLYIRDSDIPSSVTVPGVRDLPTLPENRDEWANYRSLWEMRFVCQALARFGSNSKRTIKSLFPNIDNPSETYLRRLAYNLVEGTWGNREIMKDPKLHEAFKPLMGVYLKEKKQAAKNQVKNIIKKLKAKMADEIEKTGVNAKGIIDAYQNRDWATLSSLAEKTQLTLEKKKFLDGTFAKFIVDLKTLCDSAGYLSSVERLNKV